LVEPEGAFAEARRFLRAQAGVAAVLIDQAPERRAGVAEIGFLGRRARADLTAPLLALRARVPLALVVGQRLPDGRHTVELKCVLEPPAGGGKAWAEQAISVLSRELETFVRSHPDQWLWLHRRWKGVSEGRVSDAAARGRLVASGGEG
jgi:KDO2-lipid IV(A) lauroyltransferase